ncbi:hypothetical protein ACTHSJ_19055 [Paenibacillus cellulositrophicus]|uniref:hypothetical protein n=1 Tax=Paenibacillus cellulositrophicus TaxID=562959 RepID=UPI003F812CE2
MKKKLIIASVVASLFGGAAIAGAAGNGLLGAKVQGLFSVEVNGKKINDAVVINGSTYIPVRSLSESIGAGLSVSGKKVVITTDSESTDNSIVSEGKKYEINLQIEAKQKQIENLQKQIGYYQEYWNDAKKTYDSNANDPIYKENGNKFEDSAAYKTLTEKMNEYQAEINKMKTEVDQLTNDINELKSQLSAVN